MGIEMIKVKCASCGSEMDCPPGMESMPVHICASCFDNPPPIMNSMQPGRVHIEIDPRSLVVPLKGTLLGREDEYFDILYPIEKIIVDYYRQNPKLKDRDVIKVLKSLTSNMDLRAWHSMRNELWLTVDYMAKKNGRTDREVRMCYKYVLASVKRHHAVGGQRGYLDFIVEYLEGEGVRQKQKMLM